MKIYFVGICGTAMGNGALMMRALGHDVLGSDDNIYPPMSDLLDEQGIELLTGFSAEHIESAKADVYIIGNAMSRGNPEVEAILSNRFAYSSLPEILKREIIQGRTSIVISGTHGKTTTSSLISWILESAHREPNFLIGGVPENFLQGFQVRPNSKYVVLEGDEYDTAFFDKRSKFLHYLPTHLVINNIEFDHADIFDSIDEIMLSFRRCINTVPSNGLIVANGDDDNVLSVIERAPAPLATFGLSEKCDWRAVGIIYGSNTEFTATKGGTHFGKFSLPMLGEFNVRNALAVIALSASLGLTSEEIASGLRTFRSIRRRMEKKGEFGGVTVYDDFAHHPTAIRGTLEALRRKYPDRRIIAVFEPRSNTTRRNIFQRELSECFTDANVVYLSQIARLELLLPEERLDPEKVMADIAATGTEAHYLADAKEIAQAIVKNSSDGDIVMVMSNGGFGGIHNLLREGLSSRS